MSFIDIIIVIIVIIFCIKGFLRGFIRELFSVLIIVLGLIGAFLFFRLVNDVISLFFENQDLSLII